MKKLYYLLKKILKTVWIIYYIILSDIFNGFINLIIGVYFIYYETVQKLSVRVNNA